MKTIPKVLITSVGSGVGYGVLDSFRKVRRPYQIIGANALTVAAGNFRCDTVYLLPGAHQPEGYRKSLLEILDKEHPQLVIPGHDMELPLLAEWREGIEQNFGTKILVSSPHVIRICNDKYESALFFGDPFVATANTPDQIGELVASRGFPLVVKPRKGYASQGVRVVFSQAELDATLSHSKTALIVQDFLPPAGWNKPKQNLAPDDIYDGSRLRQEQEYSVQVLMGRTGRVLGLFSSRNTLWHGIPFTVETYRDPILESAVLKMAQQLAQIGLVGPCNFQARKTPAGEFRFFEVNARFTGITPVRADMAFNECDASYRHFVEGENTLPLACPEGLWSQRYVTHDIFSTGDISVMKGAGRWPAST
jgi:carbamoyl-phosphate synthase large subunit